MFSIYYSHAFEIVYMQPVSSAFPDTRHIVLDSNIFCYLVFVEEFIA